MFVQLIQGRTSNPDGLQAAVDRWQRDIAPGATGWLGSTGGASEDGRFFAAVRFESAEAARRNSDRPEQGAWWAETEKLLNGPATFQDSSDVTVDLQGDPDQAGFVQIMQGHSSDPQRARQLMGQDSDKWAAFRPDVLGSVSVGHPDGGYTMIMYFTSEADAREGEHKEVPLELRAAMEEMNKLSTGETQFIDLKSPALRSPARR